MNLAHAQLGALSAVLLANFVLGWRWSWYGAFPVAVALGVATGLVVERAIIRRVIARSTAIESRLLVSVAISQLLLALAVIPALRPNGNRLTIEGNPLPFHAEFTFGGDVLDTRYLLILGVVPILVAGVGLMLRFTLMGKMIRGVPAARRHVQGPGEVLRG